jgi:hypothetical protein
MCPGWTKVKVVGASGFEPPTSWSRTKNKFVDSVSLNKEKQGFQTLSWTQTWTQISCPDNDIAEISWGLAIPLLDRRITTIVARESFYYPTLIE